MKRSTKIILIITAVLAALAGIGFLFTKLILQIDPRQASSIGIIGGADGPTAVFVASKTVPNFLLTLLLYGAKAVVTIGAIIHTLSRRRRNKNNDQ